jgi:SprT protein
MTTYTMTPATAPMVNAKPVEESTGQKVERWISEAFKANGVIGADIVKVEWKSDFTRRFGDANYSLGRIRLSRPLWDRATEQEREQVVKHEACHLIAFQKYGYRIMPHGREWKNAMLRAGRKPERCHNIDRTGLRRNTVRYHTSCACGYLNDRGCGPKVYRNIMVYNMVYRCPKCRSVMEVYGRGGVKE